MKPRLLLLLQAPSPTSKFELNCVHVWLLISYLGLFILLDMLFIQLFLRNKLQDKYYLIVILLFVFSSCVRFNAAVISCPYSSSVMSLSASALSWGQRQKSHTGRRLIRCPQCRRKALKRRWGGTCFVFFGLILTGPSSFLGAHPQSKSWRHKWVKLLNCISEPIL